MLKMKTNRFASEESARVWPTEATSVVVNSLWQALAHIENGF
jgi:hypothetical protein